MNFSADSKPQVQQICEQLIDKFAARLVKDTSLSLPEETQEEFLKAWREGTAERLRDQSLSFLQDSSSLNSQPGGSPAAQSQGSRRRRLSEDNSDDEFEGANLDSAGLGFSLAAAEIEFLQNHKIGPPPLEDLTPAAAAAAAAAQDRVVGHLGKVSRPADVSRPLTAERNLNWSFVIKDGIIKAGGREFAFGRLDAELREI